MKLELDFCGALCATSKFTINDVHGDDSDFGEKYDRDQENAEDYACGDMQFTRKEATSDVLKKYDINEAEYALVAGQLEAGLSFGRCGWCV